MNQTYRIQNWAEGYFSIEDGAVSLNVANDTIALNAIAESLESRHLDWPVVVRFPQILRAESDRFYDAFTVAFKKSASEKLDYQAIYPIKVNQHRSVVETLLDANPKQGLNVAVNQS